MTMRLGTAQNDRAAGVLLAQASGDALGVPYEFAARLPHDELAEMTGGGLGNFAPGEWSDDTSMALAIAEVAATGADLASDDGLDAIAEGFMRWFHSGPPDIGIQTSAVLGATARQQRNGSGIGAGRNIGLAAVMRGVALDYTSRNPHSAGNGALMRTAPVALAHLDDRSACAASARAVAELTHADPLAGDSCVLWSEAIRVAVIEGRFAVEEGLDLLPDRRRDQWRTWLHEATTPVGGVVPGARFTPNGFTVTALQAALAAITLTEIPAEEPVELSFASQHLQESLHNAVRIGNDTDTVAAIAGGLLGARWGASAVPWRWRRAVHGWPGRDGRDLVGLATLTVRGGRCDDKGWPHADDVDYDDRLSSRPVPHPHDDGVLLGTHCTRNHGATAVVSMCRVGRTQGCFDGADLVVESRLMDRDAPAENANLHFAVYDAADAVRGLRAEGHTVLLHCVAAQQRTPTVAVAYGVLLGHEPAQVQKNIRRALPTARARGRVWDSAAELSTPT